MNVKSVSIRTWFLAFSFALLAANAGCEVSSTDSRTADSPEAGSTTGGGTEAPDGGSDDGQKRVMIDGSSTVYPISQAVAEEFQGSHPNVKIVVGTSGTGGGFKKFVAGETDINDASRPIKDKEATQCNDNDIEYLEMEVAIAGISVNATTRDANKA